MEWIQSPQNPRIKLACHLRETRQRKKHQRTLIDGSREIRCAVEAGIDIETLFLCADSVEEFSSSHATQNKLAQQNYLTNRLLPHNPWLHRIPNDNLCLVSAELMAKIAFGDRSSSMLAIAKTPNFSLSQIAFRPGAIYLVLDRCEKPGNLGAAIRTADATATAAVILTDPECEPMNPNAIRASLGSIFSMPIATATPSELLAWLALHQIQAYAARVDGSQLYSQFDYRGSCAFILGSEAHGLSEEWNRPSVTSVRLPMLGTMDSLNVSVTAAVLLYEAVRQRA